MEPMEKKPPTFRISAPVFQIGFGCKYGRNQVRMLLTDVRISLGFTNPVGEA